MQNGVCPKCSSREVFVSDAPSRPQHGVSPDQFLKIYKDAKWMPDVSMIELSYYLCRPCGYVETYVKHIYELKQLEGSSN